MGSLFPKGGPLYPHPSLTQFVGITFAGALIILLVVSLATGAIHFGPPLVHFARRIFEDFDPAPEAVLWVSPGVMAPKTVPLRPAPPSVERPRPGYGFGQATFVPDFTTFGFWSTLQLMLELLFQRQTNGATLETWFSFSWKLSDGNGHFVFRVLVR